LILIFGKTKLKWDGFILRPIRISDLQGYFECYEGKDIKQAFLHISKNTNEAKKELKIKINDFKKKKPLGESFAIEVEGICRLC